MTRLASLAVAAALALSCGAVAAQEPPGRRQGPGPGADGPPREDLFKMVDAYIISNLQEGLGLSDEQFVRLLPLVKRIQTTRRGYLQRRQQALGELRRTLQAGSATDSRVGDLLRELKAIEVEEPAAVRRDQEAIDGALTPLQQAKYRVLEVEVERRLRELMTQVRQNAGARRRRDEPPPPR